jgi:uncharacterized delta-60 repeat protein/uncharacterized repeat protein (TIGR01451 family)
MKIIPRLALTIVSAALTLLAAEPASAQAPGTIDSTYDPNVTGNYVAATAVQPDGKTIIGGNFTTLQPNGAATATTRNNIARLNSDGSLDTGFDPNANAEVFSVAVQADGKILLGGNFTTLQPNGAPTPAIRNNIARLNSDGSLDTGFNPNANGRVDSVAVQADGKILLSGNFTTLQPNGAATPTTRSHIARLNSDGSLDPGFDPNANAEVFSAAVQADGKILLGGFFTTFKPNGAASATTRNFIARVNSNGSLDTGFDPNAGGGFVFSVAVQADGKILLGGFFTTIQPNGAATPTTRSHIARLNSDGSLDPSFDPNANNPVYSVAVQADGKILLGGFFTTFKPNGAASATTRNFIARVNSNGSLDTGFDPNAGGGFVFSVAVQGDGKILLGGTFSTVGGTARNHIARLNNDNAPQSLSAPDSTQVQWQRGGAAPEVSQVTFDQSTDGGATWSPLGAGTRVGTTSNWQLTGLSLPASGSLRASGRTTGGYENGGSGLIQQVDDFGPAGSVGATYDPNVTSSVLTTAVQADGKILLGGVFSSVNGTARSQMARLNSDGSLDTGFDPNANNQVLSVAVQADGKILLGGIFTKLQPNGAATPTTRNGIARLNSDGSLDTGFDPNANNQVYSLAVQADGKILLGGDFTTLQPNGAPTPTTRNHIARVNSDGSLDLGFDPNTDGELDSIVVQADGTILLGGYFTQLQPNGAATPTTRNHIARVNSDGTLDTLFDPNANSAVATVTVQADGTILLGGYFTQLQPNGAATPTTRNHIARLNSDGSLDTGFDPNAPNASGFVYSLAVQADGKILLAGDFTTLQPNGAPTPTTRNRIARLNSDGSVDSGFDPNANDTVYNVAVQMDGKILLGGEFTTVGGTARNQMARLNNDSAPQSLSAPDVTRVQWLRGGAAPEVEQVTFELATNGPWTLLGSGTRIAGGWELTGLSVPFSGSLRARGRTTNGYQNGGSGLVEQVQNFVVPPSALTYSTNPATYTKGTAITNNTPSSSGAPVVSYSISPALPTGLSFNTSTGVISGTPTVLSPAADYTVTATNTGGSTQATVNITVNDVPPSALTYSTNPAIYTKGTAITNNTPSSGGGAVVSYSVLPSLPAGLSLDPGTGIISGIPTAVAAATDYTVTATNSGGFTPVKVNITVKDVPPAGLNYSANPAVYTRTVTITNNTPSNSGGAVVSYSILPALPGGLSLSTSTGVISGAPAVLSPATNYTVTATNSGGSTTATVNITVNDVAPSVLIYSTNPATYTKNTTITNNTPTSTGGPVVSYSISPALPAGLSFSTSTGVISGTPTAVSAATDYTVTAINSGGFTTVTVNITVNPQPTPTPTPTPTPAATPTPTPTPGLVGNVSTRLPVGADDNALIEGFIVQGPAGSTKKIIVRAIGPSLAAFGIADALANPTLEIHDASNATVATNDDWQTTQVGGLITGDQSAEISASQLAPSNDLESAIIANLAPGSYTAVVRGLGNTVGTGVVDAYDLSADSPARLANIATRGLVQAGDKLMIAGFIVQNGPVTAVIRAIGPSLSAFGITNALADTTLQLRDQNGIIVLENDDWRTDQEQELLNTGLQPTNDLEAAIVVTIQPGQYTAQVRGKNDTTGIGVVQVYFLQ